MVSSSDPPRLSKREAVWSEISCMMDPPWGSFHLVTISTSGIFLTNEKHIVYWLKQLLALVIICFMQPASCGGCAPPSDPQASSGHIAQFPFYQPEYNLNRTLGRFYISATNDTQAWLQTSVDGNCSIAEVSLQAYFTNCRLQVRRTHIRGYLIKKGKKLSPVLRAVRS